MPKLNKNPDTLFNRVKSYFLEKGYGPKDRIESEVSLSKHFNVSRYQMRKTLTTLAELGILKRTSRRGTIINSFDPYSLSEQINFQFNLSYSNIAEFKEARVLVERAIMPLVVRRMPPALISKLEECIQKMVENADNPRQADTWDREFHILMFNACGNEVLKAFSTVISTLFQNEGYRKKYWHPKTIRQLAKEHGSILEAIKQGDCDLSITRLENHLGFKKLGVFAKNTYLVQTSNR